MFSDNRHIKYKKHVTGQGAIPCTNCGLHGHSYKGCMAPVNSYGIIAFRFCNTGERAHNAVLNQEDIERNICRGDPHGLLEFLLIRRKDSLRFVEFVRGKYDCEDEKYLQQMFSNMTAEEREYLKHTSFEDIWTKVWGGTYTRNYRNEYETSRQKFNMLKESGKLTEILDATSTKWDTPEWGFPKGRRNPRETDFECAVREFREETGLDEADFKVITNMEPICETFYGDNNVHYCHKYYLALCGQGVEPNIVSECPHQEREIGDIRWMNVNDAIQYIREENIEKREILLRASAILKYYSLGFRC